MILKNVRINYVNLFKSHANLSGDQIYDVQIVIPKTNVEAIEAFNSEIQSCLSRAKEDGGAKATQGAKVPELKDGDNPEHNKKGAEYLKGCYYTTLKNKKQPTLLKAIKTANGVEKVTATEEDIYNGCWAVIVANPFFYNVGPANKGVTAYLNCVIKTKNDTKLGKTINLDDIDFDDADLEQEDKNDDDWTTI